MGYSYPPSPLVCLSEPAAPAPHPQAGKPARETPSAPIAYAIVSDSIVAVGLSNCTADAVPDGWLGGYSPGCDCAATAFAVGATDQVGRRLLENDDAPGQAGSRSLRTRLRSKYLETQGYSAPDDAE